MKIYFDLSFDGFTNSYVVVNDAPDVMEAIIIDPGKVTYDMINQIEAGGYTLKGILITHNHRQHVQGLKTLLKIYSTKIYAGDFEVAGVSTEVLRGDGKIKIAGLNIEYFSVPGHSSDSMAFKIENVMFTGDTISAGRISGTTNKYSEKLLKDKIQEKILSQIEDTILMPGHGPPTTVKAEKLFNLDIK